MTSPSPTILRTRITPTQHYLWRTAGTLSAVSPVKNPAHEARIDLAAAHWLAARFGFDDGIWNHFSLKVLGRPEHFLVKAHGLL